MLDTLKKGLAIVAFSAALFAVDAATSRQAVAGSPQGDATHYGARPDLFYNYYVPPTGNGGVAAQMYVSPRPVPPMVGRTWITYQPMMPHEYLYKHRRAYYRRHPGSGLTRTVVKWH